LPGDAGFFAYGGPARRSYIPHGAELPAPVKAYFADAVLVVIAEVLLHGVGRRFSSRHAAKAVILPTRAFQPEQQVAPGLSGWFTAASPGK
jgi:hypothetical protein